MDVRTRKFALLTLPALALAASTQISQTGGIPIIAAALAQSGCQFEVVGTTVPPTSGNPVVIDDISGTVISANFFNGGAIDSPYFDGLETVSVCVSQPESNGKRTAQITTDVGLDNDFIIKGYPEFVVGTKFGNLFETSFRYYNNNGLPEEDRWPVVATGLDQQGFPFEFANLEYVSDRKAVGLPAFTTNLPNITVTLDVDEFNVVGSERDVMLESWFFDTSKNANVIGTNIATNEPVANTLNNIVGVGHQHYPQLDNTLLEMMVHIGPLSPHDISGSKNNPGQNQLTEIYSGLDFDLDGIDDHFDVDSHAYLDSTNPLDPKPGIYSSGIDQNGDGIDDADLLPVVIGDFAYSIWYGETFLSPVVIFSRETNTSLTNDFDPKTADMNLTEEGEISLPWNEFLNYTMFDLEPYLAVANVAWVIGPENPFPAMRATGGAIGGVEFGVEPQTNNASDQPYTLTVNKYLVNIDGSESGLTDIKKQKPTLSITTPSDSDSVLPADATFSGTATDTSGSGINAVRLAIRDLNDGQWYNFSNNSFNGAAGNGAVNANLTSNNWQLSVSSLPPGDYSLFINVIDNAGNASGFSSRRFTVTITDNELPIATFTTPSANNRTVANTTFEGTATDTGGSGINVVRVAIRDLNAGQWYNFSNNSFSGAVGNGAVNADLTADNWQLSVSYLPPGSYSLFINAIDNAGNTSGFSSRRINVIAPDNQPPVADFTTPSRNNASLPANALFEGTATDTGGSGLDTIRLAIRDVDNGQWYNFSNNTFSGASGNGATNANLTGDNWQLSVSSLAAGNYSLFINAIDNEGNASGFSSRRFSVTVGDTQPPVAIFTTPPTINAIVSPNVTFEGTATDNGSGLKVVRLAIRDVSAGTWYNFSNDSFSGTAGNGAVDADLTGINWQLSVSSLPPGDYSLFMNAIDNANNASGFSSRRFIVE